MDLLVKLLYNIFRQKTNLEEGFLGMVLEIIYKQQER